MSKSGLFEALLSAGRVEDYSAVAALPGACIHAEVGRFSYTLRGAGLGEFENLSQVDRKAFVKALAAYENTVGGLGSTTALQHLLPLVHDEGETLLDWILSNTRSYWYYSHGAKSIAELQRINAAHAVRSAENMQREAERERQAKIRKAEMASAFLFNAIRRGDVRAVQGLLNRGASYLGATPDGLPLVKYAESLGRAEIAELLRQAHGDGCASP